MQGMMTNFHGLKGRVNEVAAKQGIELPDAGEVGLSSAPTTQVTSEAAAPTAGQAARPVAAGGEGVGGKAAGGAAAGKTASRREVGMEAEEASPPAGSAQAAGSTPGSAARNARPGSPSALSRVGNRVKMANSASDAVSRQSMGAADRKEMQERRVTRPQRAPPPVKRLTAPPTTHSGYRRAREAYHPSSPHPPTGHRTGSSG